MVYPQKAGPTVPAPADTSPREREIWNNKTTTACGTKGRRRTKVILRVNFLSSHHSHIPSSLRKTPHPPRVFVREAIMYGERGGKNTNKRKTIQI